MSLRMPFYAFIVLFCTCHFLRSIIGNYQNSIVQSVERQFQLSSTVSGALLTAIDIGYLLTVLIMSYAGSKGNPVRFLGASFIITSLGCALMAVPQFITHEAASDMEVMDVFLESEISENDSTTVPERLSTNILCNLNYPGGNDHFEPLLECESRPPLYAGFAVVFIALFVIGVGNSMPWSLGVPTVDDLSIDKKNTPLYFGAIHLLKVLGPLIGALLGAFLAKYYVTLGDPPRSISESDTSWISAWWLGYVAVGAALLLPSIGLLCYSPIRGTSGTSTPSLAPKASFERVQQSADCGTDFLNIIWSLLRIMKQPLFLALMVDDVLGTLAYKGFNLFMPKYVENQFGLTMFQSNVYSNCTGILGNATGICSASLLLRKQVNTGRRAATLLLVCSSLCTAAYVSQMLLQCPSATKLATVQQQGVINANCNFDCNCTNSPFLPVCSENEDAVYYNPCSAGCSSVTSLGGNVIYDNCSCSSERLSNSFCRNSCSSYAVAYFILRFIASAAYGMTMVPFTLLLIRSVPYDKRSLALGLSGFVTTLIAKLSSSIIMGAIVDSTCTLWSQPCLDDQGSCQLYDISLLRTRSYALLGSLRGFSVVANVAIWFFAKDTKLKRDPSENNIELTSKSVSCTEDPIIKQQI